MKAEFPVKPMCDNDFGLAGVLVRRLNFQIKLMVLYQESKA